MSEEKARWKGEIERVWPLPAQNMGGGRRGVVCEDGKHAYVHIYIWKYSRAGFCIYDRLSLVDDR